MNITKQKLEDVEERMRAQGTLNQSPKRTEQREVIQKYFERYSLYSYERYWSKINEKKSHTDTMQGTWRRLKDREKMLLAVRVKRQIQIKERIILTASLQQQESYKELKETNLHWDSSSH